MFRFFLITLFVIFATLYLSEATGYYNYKQQNKVALTTEKIKQFEQDIKKGKEIDVKQYLEVKENSYQNGFSKAGLKLSNGVSKYVQRGVKGLLVVLEKLLMENICYNFDR